MKLKLTYRRPSGPDVDVVVTTEATASIGDLARELIRRDPRPGERQRAAKDATLAVSPPGVERFVPLDARALVGEAALASGYHVKVSTSDPKAREDRSGRATLTVVSGVQAGQRFSLGTGGTVIGRSEADVVLDDPFVSKRHARVDVAEDGGVEVVDLNSANGIVVEGVVVTRIKVGSEQTFELGETMLRVTTHGTAGGASGTIVAGAVPFHRSPRVEVRYPHREHARPLAPKEADQQPFAWLMLIGPVAMGGAMFAITRSPISLMIVAMAPFMMFASHTQSRQRSKRQLAVEVERFEAQIEELSTALATERPLEQQVRQWEVPPVSALRESAAARDSLLWTRRAEHWTSLFVRLGVATLPSRNVVAAPAAAEDGLPEYTTRVADLEAEYRWIPDVPVLEDLRLSGALGLVGPQPARDDAARSVLVQLAALHSPADLVITAIIGDEETADFSWLAWLPHTGSAQSPVVGSHLADSGPAAAGLLAQLEAVIEARTRSADADADHKGPLPSRLRASSAGGELDKGDDGPEESFPGPVVVVLLSASAAVDRSRLVQLSERAARVGVVPIWIAQHVGDLPAVARTFVDVTPGLSAATAHFVRHGTTVTPLDVEGVSAPEALAFAHALAPLADSGAVLVDSSDLPQQVALLTLLGDELAESAEAVVDRWQQNLSMHDRSGTPSRRRRAGTLRAIVGQGAQDALHLDLRTHGPHALVGGTTGSGKSEFLQAWVLAMAAEYSPDRVTFLFVDYKGGAAFADCVNLPHCVGLVTDLSPHLVRRALTSLRAELHHREHLLNSKKAKDLLELEKRGDPDSPPALILVIDEFAALAGEVPEFVDGVVDIAQRGRSLGIHLIMATQRPAGVIKDNLRANTNLRVALRMADESDSTDVIGNPDAAAFDPTLPGRGVAKVGPGRLVPFQSAYAGGHTHGVEVRPAVEVRPLGFGVDAPWEATDDVAADAGRDDLGPTDQKRLVATITRAWRLAELPEPRRPWLDELSSAYDLSLLQPRTDTALVLGVADLPHQQTQQTMFFEPDVDGNLAVYGTSGAGKSVLLRTLAVSAGVTPRGGPVHVYCLDFAAGGLAMLEPLVHVGAVISGDDTERVARLLRTLRELAERRAREFPAVHAGNIVDFRANADRPDEPRILLLLDGFPAFRDQWEVGAGRAEWYDAFEQLLKEGRGLGIHVAFTADRPAGVPGAVSAATPRRVVMRLADQSMYLALGVDGDVLSASSPAGRVLLDDRETQIAILGGSGTVTDQAVAISAFAEAQGRRGVTPASPIGALPTEVRLDDLPDRAPDGRPVLGISDLDLQPVGFTPTGTFLLAGGPQSGRSTALAALARSLRRWDEDVYLVYLGTKRSPLPGMLEWDVAATAPQDVVDVARQQIAKIESDDGDKVVVVVEALNEIAVSPVDSALVDLFKAIKRSTHLVIAEAETSGWVSSFPVYSEIKGGRRGLVLQPDTTEGDTLLRTTFPRVRRAEFPQGRGLWAEAGRVSAVQVPLA